MPTNNPKSINAQSFDDSAGDAAANALANSKAVADAFKATDGSDDATAQSAKAKRALVKGA